MNILEKIIKWFKGLFKKDPKQETKEFPDGLIWLHHNVSTWQKTATLNVHQNGNIIDVVYDKSLTWPAKTTAGAKVNANVWIIATLPDGKTYTGIWEYLRYGQTKKDMRGKSWGGHIKVSPMNKFEPKKGERYGIFVSGLCRTSVRNVSERSNVCWFTWK